MRRKRQPLPPSRPATQGPDPSARGPLAHWRVVLPGLLTAGYLLCGWGVAGAWAQSQPPTEPPRQLPALLTPAGQLNAAWRVVGFPKKQTDLPLTRFEAAQADASHRAVRVSSASAYGTLVHDWRGPVPGPLQWTWRLDQPLSQGKAPPDLTSKAGDDAALKLCVMFDHPLERVPLVERTLLRLARSLSGEALPAATVCYVWDSAQPAGLRGANPYTRRVRYISLRGTEAPLNQWLPESRQPAQDYAELFSDEASATGPAPPVLAVVLGADSDNTTSVSLGWFGPLGWRLPATPATATTSATPATGP